MSVVDKYYIDTLKQIISQGTDTEESNLDTRGVWEDGNTAHTKKIFGVTHRYDLRKEFPLLSARRVPYAKCIDELLWIWQKKSNNVNDLNSHIWDSWTDEEGSIGKAYGYQLGAKFMFNGVETDQVDFIINCLKNNPFDRAMITNMHSHKDLDEMHLRACAFMCIFNVTLDEDKNKVLNMMLVQRSQDMIVANGWNVAQYAFLMVLMAKVTGMIPGELLHVISDCHIYKKHIPVAEYIIDQYEIQEHDIPVPKVSIKDTVTDFYEATVEDFIVEDYDWYTDIKGIPVAV